MERVKQCALCALLHEVRARKGRKLGQLPQAAALALCRKHLCAPTPDVWQL